MHVVIVASVISFFLTSSKMKENLYNCTKGKEKEPGECMLKMLERKEICWRAHSIKTLESVRVSRYKGKKLDLKELVVGGRVAFSFSS